VQLKSEARMQEPLPEPTAAELAKEAEQEASVFAQAVNVDKLLTMLRGLDPAKDNLADNEEIQVGPNCPLSIDDKMKSSSCRNCTDRAWHCDPKLSN
jgi:hypothetical protein